MNIVLFLWNESQDGLADNLFLNGKSTMGSASPLALSLLKGTASAINDHLPGLQYIRPIRQLSTINEAIGKL